MGRIEKQPVSSVGNVVSAPVPGWTRTVAAWAGTIWPISESGVT